MRTYNRRLKHRAQRLRANMTDGERRLWSRLRGKQLLDVPFYRQKPIGHYIVDFYAPRVGLVVEVDGSQHFEAAHATHDIQRDAYLVGQGLRVLRFDNMQVLQALDEVVEVVFRAMEEEIRSGRRKIPPNPPFAKGGN